MFLVAGKEKLVLYMQPGLETSPPAGSIGPGGGRAQELSLGAEPGGRG